MLSTLPQSLLNASKSNNNNNSNNEMPPTDYNRSYKHSNVLQTVRQQPYQTQQSNQPQILRTMPTLYSMQPRALPHFNTLLALNVTKYFSSRVQIPLQQSPQWTGVPQSIIASNLAQIAARKVKLCRLKN